MLRWYDMSTSGFSDILFIGQRESEFIGMLSEDLPTPHPFIRDFSWQKIDRKAFFNVNIVSNSYGQFILWGHNLALLTRNYTLFSFCLQVWNKPNALLFISTEKLRIYTDWTRQYLIQIVFLNNCFVLLPLTEVIFIKCFSTELHSSVRFSSVSYVIGFTIRSEFYHMFLQEDR